MSQRSDDWTVVCSYELNRANDKIKNLEKIVTLQTETIRGLEHLLDEVPFVFRGIRDVYAVTKQFSNSYKKAVERLEVLDQKIAELKKESPR